MPKSNLKYFFAGILSFAIWGFFSIPLRNLIGFPSEEILYYRVFTSAIFLWLGIFIFRKRQLNRDLSYLLSVTKQEKNTILLQIVSSTFFLMSNWYTFIYTVNNVSLQSAAFAYMVCPLITAFGGFLLLKEELSKLKLISLAIALFSVILLATGSFKEVAWSIIIAALYAFYLILQRKMQDIDKLNVLAVQISLGAIVILPFYLFKHQAFPTDSWFWGNITIVALIFTIIPLFLSLYALIGIPSSTLGIIIYINPIIAFAIAILYFDEYIDSHKLSAYLLLLISVIVFNWGIIKDILTFKRKNV